MGVESYCVKFYLVRDLWRAWRWRGEETRPWHLDHGGPQISGCICEAGVRVCPPVGEFSMCSGLPQAPNRGNPSRSEAQVPLTMSSPPPVPPGGSEVTRLYMDCIYMDLTASQGCSFAGSLFLGRWLWLFWLPGFLNSDCCFLGGEE